MPSVLPRAHTAESGRDVLFF